MSERQQDEIDHYRGKVIPEMQAEIDRLRNYLNRCEHLLNVARNYIEINKETEGADRLITDIDRYFHETEPDLARGGEK